MNDDFDNLMWAYRAVFTQAGAGGGTVIVLITANERTVILYGTIGPDDYAAGRALSGRVTDGTNIIGHVSFPDSVDNERILVLTSAAAAHVPNAGLELEKRLVLGKGDVLRIAIASLVQNETLTIALRALFRSWPPTVTTTGSGGTVTVATTYSKVI